MREPHIFISRARLVAQPQIFKTANNRTLLSLRIAVNPGRYDQDHKWHDGTTQYYTVEVFGRNQNRYTNLHQGEEVAVAGKLQFHNYQKDGQNRLNLKIIGADMTIVPQLPKDNQEQDFGDPQF